MTELFESTMDNVSDIDIKCYSDPDPEHTVLEIFATSGEEAYMYKFTGPGVRINGLYKLITNNEKLRSENQNLKEENKNLKQEKEEREVSAVAAKEKNKLLEIENEKLNKELHSLKQEKSKIPMVDDCLKLSKEIEKLTFENEMMKKGNEKFKKVNERLWNENQELKKDLKEIQEAFPMTANKILYGEGELKVENKDTDNVNHPSHYETGKFECIEVMQEVFGIGAVINFCKCNAFKYVYRMDRKNGTEDAKKAIWYLNKYLELQDELVNELFDDGGERDGERHKDK